MTGRHVTTAVTMLVLVGILVLGVVVGARELFAPLPGADEETPSGRALTELRAFGGPAQSAQKPSDHGQRLQRRDSRGSRRTDPQDPLQAGLPGR